MPRKATKRPRRATPNATLANEIHEVLKIVRATSDTVRRQQEHLERHDAEHLQHRERLDDHHKVLAEMGVDLSIFLSKGLEEVKEIGRRLTDAAKGFNMLYQEERAVTRMRLDALEGPKF